MPDESKLRPIVFTNPLGTQVSAWPALVDRGQNVLGPMTVEHLVTIFNELDPQQLVHVLTLVAKRKSAKRDVIRAMGLTGRDLFEMIPERSDEDEAADNGDPPPLL